MPVSIRWYDPEKTIILYDVSGRWTWAEFFEAYDEAIKMINTSNHAVIHGIINTLPDVPLAYMPANTISGFMNAVRRLPSKSGIGVLVNPGSKLLQAMHDTVSRLYPPYGRRVALVDTFEAALERIRQHTESEKS